MITVNNQKPSELSPLIQTTITGAYNPRDMLKTNIISTLFQPLIANHPVEIIDGKGNKLTEDDVTDLVLDCCDDKLSQNEDLVKEIFGKTLVDYNRQNTLLVKDVFAIQSADKEKMKYPSDIIIYTPATDIIPVCKNYLAGNASYDELFATFAFYTRADSVGIYFANAIEFDEFKQFFTNKCQILASNLTADVNQLCAEFDKLTLNELTESLILRKDVADNNEDYSFPRLLSSALYEFITTNNNGLSGIFPFTLSDTVCPKTMIFINLEKHAHSTPQAIKREWQIINSSLNIPIKMISVNRLNKLTATARAIAKAQAQAVQATKQTIQNNMQAKQARIRFTAKPPSYQDMIYRISKIIKKMSDVNKSQNPYKMTKRTFARPNRRDPEDCTRKGKSTSKRFKPDIHVYIDTSGSISEENYREAIAACIELARKCNVNLYFNSFSHILSQTTLLHTKDKPSAAIYKEFEKTPKVTGWTNFEQIWHFINKSKKRTREFSLIITDFEWCAGNYFVKHPKNLYYIPCAKMDWQRMKREAEKFCKSAEHNDPNIRKHLLF